MRAILILIPLLTLAFLTLTVYRRFNGFGYRVRFSILISATILGVYTVFITEFLSLFHWLNFPAIASSWLVALCISIYLLMSRSARAAGEPGSAHSETTAADMFFIGIAGLILLAVGAIALIAPPNHWDVLTYHMSRVMHWQQNLSVTHYPTHIARQLFMGPFSEYAILHLQVLAGSDRFANMIQWAGYAGSALSASLLAAQLGAQRPGQILAMIFVATLPIAILQASVAKNDCMLGFWFLAAFNFILLIKRSSGLIEIALLMGAAFGLAILTKTTAFIFLFPIAIWLVLWAIRKHKLDALKILLSAGSIAVLLNTPFWIRNYQLFGHPLGKSYETPASDSDPSFRKRQTKQILNYRNDEMNPSLFLSNVLRNVAVHAVTPFESLNAGIYATVLKIHEWAGVNPNDPRTTWHYSRFKRKTGISYNDETGSPLHLLAAMIVAGYCLTRFRDSSNRNLFQPAFVLTSAFLLICFLVRWHHTFPRLHIPLFFLSAALTGRVLSRFPHVSRILALLMLICAVPWLIFNETRPLTGAGNIFSTGRYEQYFASRNTKAYESAFDFIASRHCTDVGFRFSWWNETEYQFWMMLKQSSSSAFHVRHVSVENESAKLSDPSHFIPCAVLLLDYSRKLPDRLTVNGTTFVTDQAFVNGTARVLLPSKQDSQFISP